MVAIHRDIQPAPPDPGYTPPPWRDLARCLDTDPALWFPPQGLAGQRAVQAARQFCDLCWVKAECLADALQAATTGSDHGIRAGTTPAQRDRIRQRRTRDNHQPQYPALSYRTAR